MLRIAWTLAAALLLCPPAFAQPVLRTLWVDPAGVKLTDPAVAAQVLAQPVRRLVVTAFAFGETLYPTEQKLFRQMPAYRGKGDVLKDLLRQAHRQGKEVYLHLDCLQWTDRLRDGAHDPFAAAPELEELTSFHQLFRRGPKYASPFHPQVRRALEALVGEAAGRYPDLDGVLLRCRLAGHTAFPLGYSPAARAAAMGAGLADPTKIRWDSRKEPTQETAEVAAWREFRLGQMGRLVADLARAVKARLPAARVAALGQANFSRKSRAYQLCTLEDVVRWARAGAVDEVILEFPPNESDNGPGYADVRAALGRPGRAARLAVLLPLDGQLEGESVFLHPVLKALHGQAVEGLVFRVGYGGGSGLEELVTLLKRWELLPLFEATLPRPDLQVLADDRRLQVGMEVENGKLPELLRALGKATGLAFRHSPGAEAGRPLFPWSWASKSAYELMQEIALAELITGRWEKTEAGYLLRAGRPGHPAAAGVPVAAAAVQEPPAALAPWLSGIVFAFAGIIIVLVVLGVLLALKKRAARTG